MKRFRPLYYRILVVLLLGLSGCNVTQFVPEEEFLYDGGTVEINNQSGEENLGSLEDQLEAVLRPEPNSKILGSRVGLYFHYKAQQESPGFINRFFNKRLGEEPVYLSDVNPDQVEEILLNRLENQGYFYSRVTSSIETDTTDKEAVARYRVNLPRPYVLEQYHLESDSTQIYDEIQNNLDQTLIQPGMKFSLGALKAERDRIEQDLKKKGYYNFNPQFLLFEADTNQYNQRKFDLYLRLKNDVQQRGRIPYEIKQINVYPAYGMEADTVIAEPVRINDMNFYQEEEFFKPERMAPYVLLKEGQLYDPETSRYTSRRLSAIGAYKFINIAYEEIDSLTSDTLGALRTDIYLSPLNKRSLRAELQAVTKSNDFMGPNLALTYTNRNLFRGGEILNLTAKLGYEWQMASGNNRNLNSIQLGGDADLVVPRMLFPISLNTDSYWFRYSIPKTKISLGANLLSRSNLYSMYSFRGAFGYTWRANRYVMHELDPISINYVRLGNTTEEFQEILDANPYLQESFSQEFIAGLLYSYTYNGMVDANDPHQFFVNTNLDIAGNAVSLLSGDSDGEGSEFLGLTYAQYAKMDVDFRFHLQVGSDQKIATRLFAGYGLPYGNSTTMPFSKQYFSGGPYSVRAFRIRSLGPGSYNPEASEQSTYFDQAGNVRLEANLEYRFPIISFLKGAVFVDAGNVWNTGDTQYLEGGKFSSDFLTELGIGAGVGLRVDIQSFVIRFDLASPMHIPWLEKGERWDFRWDEPVLNFGVGYPF